MPTPSTDPDNVFAAPTAVLIDEGLISPSTRHSLSIIRGSAIIVSVALIALVLAQLLVAVTVTFSWVRATHSTGRPGIIVLIIVLSLAAAIVAGLQTAGLFRMRSAIRQYFETGTPNDMVVVLDRHARIWRMNLILFVHLLGIYIISGL